MTAIDSVAIRITQDVDSDDENKERDRKVNRCVKDVFCSLGVVISGAAGAVCFEAQKDEWGALLIAVACAMLIGYWFIRCEAKQEEHNPLVKPESR